MKNLTKIFMAVAVAMFAFACVTDTTEDLGIEVGKGGVTPRSPFRWRRAVPSSARRLTACILFIGARATLSQ